MDERQQELQEKLIELKRFEENERNQMLLQSKKSILTTEQLQMYQMLGINLSSFTQLNYDPGDLDERNDENEFEDFHQNIQEIEHTDDSDDNDEHESHLNTSQTKEYNNELVHNTLEKGASLYLKDDGNNQQQVVKKPFLKRGAGLSSRFRIPPDAYNLKNLPRYKYQDRLQKTIRKQKGIFVQEEPKAGATRKSNENPKRTSSEGIKTSSIGEIKRSSETKRTSSEETKTFNEIKRTSSECMKTSSETRKSNDLKRSENKENFQPKISTEKIESNELIVPKNIALKVPTENIRLPPQPLDIEKLLTKPHRVTEIIEETPKVVRTTKSTCWAQILSSNNISDCSIKINQLLSEPRDDEHNETDLFHLLEERIKNLESSPSELMKLLTMLKPREENDDDTIVNPEDPLIENADAACLHILPRPDELGKKIIIDDSEDSEDSDDDDQKTLSSDHRVRFAENVEVMQQNTMNDDEANSTILSSDLEVTDLTQTSTPNDKIRNYQENLKFDDFKLKIIGRQKEHEELIEKAEQLKIKLQEIEREKANILKMRSALELDRIQFENEREDFAERMKDERIKMELELHDERLKVDQQRQKYEKMMREAKNQASKKEREEIAKLKENIEEIKEEMKNKETRHASTTARFRSQVKQLEKENQTLKLELEVAQKDNKRLELENARLKRDTNSKMLQEINKNIAKLAEPKNVEKPQEKPKTVIKKVPPKKSEPTRKSAPIKTPEISSDSDDDEEQKMKILNPVRTRMSDPANSRNSKTPEPTSSKSSMDIFSEMKREIVNSDGSKDIWYPNGNLKKISPDGMMIRMLYYNKDIKETNINEGTVKYYYAENNTWHTTYIDGLEILEYPSGQIEHRYKDGTNEIHYPDGSIRITNENWTNDVKEEWRMPDGTNAKIFKNNTKILSFPNGQREVHTENHKRREYPDGTVKLMYTDGTMETRYSNGRVRVKDKDGNLISDNMKS